MRFHEASWDIMFHHEIMSHHENIMSSLYFLLPAHTLLVVTVLEHVPLPLHGGVRLHLQLRLRPLHAVLVVVRNQVVEEQRIDTFVTVFGKHTDKKQVESL